MIDVSPLTHLMNQVQPAPADTPRPVAPVQPVASAQGAESGGARDSGKKPLDTAVPGGSQAMARDASLQFRIDKDFDRLVVSLLDREGEVIRQVPAELVLKIAQRIEQIISDNKLGLDERA